MHLHVTDADLDPILSPTQLFDVAGIFGEHSDITHDLNAQIRHTGSLTHLQ